jgi:tripartite-type tricarboxylate transporter receptor subunit TctC
MEMESFMIEAGISMVHVPYKGGAGAANTALVAGEVQVGMLTVASVIPHVRAGRLKVLGVAASRRSGALPTVPTMPEAGFPKMTTGSWQGVYMPAGTPQAIVNRLHAAFHKVMADPDVVARLGNGGADVVLSKSPAEFAAFMKAQNAHYEKLVKQVGAVAE